MNRIESFSVNHNLLEPGLYLSRIDDDIVTYDVRLMKPNNGAYLENDGIHTMEHLFATFVRNTKYSDNIVYVGPMGCRTGFYFLTRDSISHNEVITLLQDTFKYIKEYEGEICGSSKIECGNYLDHNLKKAKKYASDFLPIINAATVEKMEYLK